MRICIYTETALPMLGGQELVVDRLARQFLAAGHQVVMLAPTPRSAFRSAGWREADRLFPYPMVRHPRFVSTRRFVEPYTFWLRRIRRIYGFDILHCHSTYPTGYLGVRLGRKLGFRVVVTSHGGDVTPTNSKLSDQRIRNRYIETMTGADALVAISDSITESYRRLVPDCKFIRIPNGVDVAEFSATAPRPGNLDPAIQPKRYVLFLGRLNHQKGVDLLIEAAAKLPQRERPLLVIAGDGPERPALEQLAAKLGVAGNVCFVGVVTGNLKIFLLQNSLVNLMPSRQWEGFPLVILESFAAGRPLIVTQIPGSAGLVRHLETGWLVKPDSPDALANAIRTAIADGPTRERLGRNARAEAVRYDWKIVAAKYLKLFATLRAHSPL